MSPLFNKPFCYSFQMLWPTNMTGAHSVEVERSGYRTQKYSSRNWRKNMQPTNSSQRTRGERFQRQPTYPSVKSRFGFRTGGLRKRNSLPKLRTLRHKAKLHFCFSRWLQMKKSKNARTFFGLGDECFIFPAHLHQKEKEKRKKEWDSKMNNRNKWKTWKDNIACI